MPAPMQRPEPPGGSGKGEGKIKYSERNAELADAEARKFFLEHSGKLARTNHDFKALIGIFKGLQVLGLDVDPLKQVFEAFEERTPDPESRKEVLQMYAQPKIIIPGIGAGMMGDEKPGLIKRAINWIKPGKEGEG